MLWPPPPDRNMPDYAAYFSIADKEIFGPPDAGAARVISAGTATGGDAMHIVYRHLNELALNSGRAVLCCWRTCACCSGKTRTPSTGMS